MIKWGTFILVSCLELLIEWHISFFLYAYISVYMFIPPILSVSSHYYSACFFSLFFHIHFYFIPFSSFFSVFLNRYAAVVKKYLMGYKHRIKYLRFKKSMTSLQNNFRIFRSKKILRKLRSIFYAVRIQSYIRMRTRRKRYFIVLAAALRLSAWIRMIILRVKYIEIIRAAKLAKWQEEQLAFQVENLKSQLILEAEMRLEAERVRTVRIVRTS